jgi:uncharacterized membrane protein
VRAVNEAGVTMATNQTVARGLGFFSIGLGLSQLLAPRWFARTIGVQPRNENETVVRLVGVRELIAAVGLLAAKNPAPWLWMRVAGDIMDLALLGRATGSRDTAEPDRLSSALAGTVAVTAVDVASAGASSTRPANRQGAAHRNGGNGHAGNGARFLEDLGVRVKGGFLSEKPVRESVTIGRSPAELYRFWREFQNLPRFMRHLESVRDLGEGRSHWVATAPAGMRVEWDAEITNDVPDERISWRSLPGASVRHEGTVEFLPAPGDRGTEVHVELIYQPPAGAVGVAIAKLFGEEPKQQINEDLRRFKQMMETGRVVWSEATGGERRVRQRPAQPIPAAAAARP